MANSHTPTAFKCLVLAVLAAGSVAASAKATYTYTGPVLTSFSNGDPSHPVSAAGLVASLVFENTIAPNTGTTDSFQNIAPMSWSFSGGGYELSSTDTDATLFSGFFTNAAGSLVGWDLFAYQAPDRNGPRFRTFNYPTGQFSTFGSPIKTDGAFFWNQPAGISEGLNTALTGGNWTLTVTPIPEPGSLALLLAGLGAIGWGTRRRAAVRSATSEKTLGAGPA